MTIARSIAVLLLIIMPGIFLAMQPMSRTMIPYNRFHSHEIIQDNPTTALLHAAEMGFADTIPDLVALGADVNAELPGFSDIYPGEYITPLMVAVGPFSLSWRPTEIGKVTLSHYISTHLSKSKAATFIEVLIRQGALVDKISRHGRTAIQYAVSANNKEAVTALIKHGAEVNVVKDTWHSSLYAAIASNSSPEVINLLLNHGARIDEVDYLCGATPLICAVNSRNIENVRLLLERGANAALEIRGGDTALTIAKLLGNEAMIDLLEQHLAKGM